MFKRLILAAAVSFAMSAHAAEFPDYPFVHTGGTGFTYAAPDLGEIDFEVSVFNADPAAARAAVDERLAQVRALLGQAGLPDEDIDVFLVGFDTSKREQIESALTAEALANARRKAEAIAAGVGRKLGPASAVSMGDLKNVTRAVGLGGVREAAYRNPVRADPDREGLLMIVPMKLSQSVDVIYRFK